MANGTKPTWGREASCIAGESKYVLDNLTILRSANRATKWKWHMYHTPSWLYMCQSIHLDDLKRFGIAIRERFDLRVLDRLAMGTMDAEDEAVVEEIKGLIGETKGVSR